MGAQPRRSGHHHRAGRLQSGADGDPGFSVDPGGNFRRIQRHTPVAWLRARLSDRLSGAGLPGSASGRSRATHRRHRARLRQQRTGDHRLHAIDHAAGVSGNARRQSRLASRRGSGGLDRNHQASGCTVRPGVSKIHSHSRRHDGVRRGHVQLSRAGPAAARVRSAPRRTDRARDYLHQRFGQHPDHALAHSAVHRGMDHPTRWSPWQSDTYIPPGPAFRSSFLSPPLGNRCAR